MKRVIRVFLLLGILAAVGCVIFLTYRTIRDRRRLAVQEEETQPRPTVSVERIETATLTRSINVTGEIEAMSTVSLVPKVTGRLERLRLPGGELLEEGDAVRAGQIVARIESGALEAAVQAAQANLLRARVQARPEVIASQIEAASAAFAAAEAQLAEAEANLVNLEKDRDRMVRLFQEGSIHEQAKDAAVTAHEAATKRRDAMLAQVSNARAALALTEAQTEDLAEAGVAQAEAALLQARVNLEEATIESPINGVVCGKYVDEGDMVGPGTIIVRVEQMDTVKITGGVSERHISFLRPGRTEVFVTVDAYPDEEFAGTVCRVGPDVDPRTRTVEVEVRVPNPDHRLGTGMFARMELSLERRENVPVISDTALLREGSAVYAYVVNGSRAHRKALRLGLSEGVWHEILEGAKPGDLVVVRGQRMLRDGMEVSIAQEGTE